MVGDTSSRIACSISALWVSFEGHQQSELSQNNALRKNSRGSRKQMCISGWKLEVCACSGSGFVSVEGCEGAVWWGGRWAESLQGLIFCWAAHVNQQKKSCACNCGGNSSLEGALQLNFSQHLEHLMSFDGVGVWVGGHHCPATSAWNTPAGNSELQLKLLLYVQQQTLDNGVWSLAKFGCWLGFTQEGGLETNNEQHDAFQYQSEWFPYPCLSSALLAWAVTPSQVRCSLQIYVGLSGSPILIFPSHFPGSFLFCADFPWKYQVLFCYSAEAAPFPPCLPLHQHFVSQLNRRSTSRIFQLKKMLFNVCMHCSFLQASFTTFSAVPRVLFCNYFTIIQNIFHSGSAFFPHIFIAELTTSTDCPVLFICFMEITWGFQSFLFGYPVSVKIYFWLQIP